MEFERLTQTYKTLLEKTMQKTEILIREKYALCDALVKTIHEANNNIQTHLNLQNIYIEPLIREVCETIHKIEKYNIENHLKFVSTLTGEYERISSLDIHPDMMKREMLEHLDSTSKQLRNFYEFEGLREIIVSLQKNLHTLFQNEPNCIDNIKKFERMIYDCQHQYHENIQFLHTLMEYFSQPTECPPHL